MTERLGELAIRAVSPVAEADVGDWPFPFDRDVLARRAQQIADCARELSSLNWTPATSSNFSMRIDDRHVAVTVSGLDKGRLTPSDIIVVDLDGRSLVGERSPSAETVLHTRLYRRLPEIGCVHHTHSVRQTVAARLFAPKGRVRLAGYELLKAYAGCTTHDTVVDVPVLANNQDIPAIATEVERLIVGGPLWGYLIDGHGLYTWGRDLPEARRHLEALEFLLACELELRRISG